MRNKLLLASALAASLISSAFTPAQAATMTYDWSLTGPAASLGGFTGTGSGTLTVTTGVNGDILTSFLGQVNGNTITALLSPSTAADNLIFPVGTTFGSGGSSYVSASNLDPNGFEFQTSQGTFHIFGFYAPNSTDVTIGNNYGEIAPGGFGVGTFALTAAVPEPSTWAMMLLGFVGLTFLGYRRRSANAAV